jgi:TRAP-type C4-dicarboxylate transport system substrate-binding protein
MPQDIQKILLEEWQTTSRERNEYFIRKAKENLDTMRERGMEVILLDKAERDRYVEAVKPYVDKAIADMGDFGQKVRQIADEVNAKYAYPY